ncbi:hypothetical protein HK099_005935 [Clydaea vesicula]|uniref:Maf-like protein n=1 Tax=Clydaea vesicula TaxID=447962 RepID=A0AAD5TYG1_9FUNG|nr:hypothetical protein HK099_005935 [Clydaea vesicula]
MNMYELKNFFYFAALEKAKDVAFTKLKGDFDLLISADTVINYNNIILEKPRDEKHCKEILSLLSGKKHSVLTATVLFFPIKNKELTIKLEEKDCQKDFVFNNSNFKAAFFVEETLVEFDALDEELIEGYLGSKEWTDKAAG